MQVRWVRNILTWLAAGMVAGAGMAHAANPPRVVSLDGCADQYVLGLVPMADIAAVSDRAGLPESYFRDRVGKIRQVKPYLETILALEPDIVVRTWGGDLKLLQRLQHHGIKVVTINDVYNYNQARDELFRVGDAVEQPASARIEARRFEEALENIHDIGRGRSVLYYSPSGYSAGPDTMVGDILTRLGFRLETQTKGFFYLSPEVMLTKKPDVFALGFFDDKVSMRRVPGRSPVVRKIIAGRPNLILPSRAMACSGWFTAYDIESLSLVGFR
jgi:iron complex transport system substrate-binding protein